MTLEEWRKQFCQNGVPSFVPCPEVNTGVDMCTPKTFSAMDARVPAEPAPAQYDGIKIEDMKDPGFRDAVFGPNKFIRRDAVVNYTREVGTNIERAKFVAKMNKN